MLTHTDARNNTNSYGYDVLGAFVYDNNSEGGGWKIERVSNDEDGDSLLK